MLTTKAEERGQYEMICMEELVPEDHILRKIDSAIDFTRIYEVCKVIDNILHEDVLFTSPSSAAEFVTGKSCNGWVSWRTKDGKTLHDLEEQE